MSEGCYMLRSNVTDWTPEELWRAYIQLTEAEAAFRIQKSDLQIRPVWHQRADRVQGTFWSASLLMFLWKALGQMCHMAGLGDEPRKVFEGAEGNLIGRCGSTDTEWNHSAQAMCFPALRTSIDTVTKTPADAPIHDGNRSNVVETRHDPR